MSITDELRKVAAKTECANGRCEKLYRGDLDHIADRIDQGHKNAVMGAMNDALYYANDESMAELGWVRLPRDADGVTIRIGDVMEWPDGSTFEVVGIGDGTLYYVEGDGADHAEWTVASTKRHHHAPTVEDVLREFAERVCDSGHQWGLDAADTIAEYATKLRLAGEGA